MRKFLKILGGTVLTVLAVLTVRTGQAAEPLMSQTTAQAHAKSAGCLSCHNGVEEMHTSPVVHLGCIDCHGGNNSIKRESSIAKDSDAYKALKNQAHPKPSFPEKWKNSGNPIRPYTLTLKENKEWLKFVNPSDFRVVETTCGLCHNEETKNSQTSIMTTSATLWGGAAYNNGIVSTKNYILGESYNNDGVAQKLEMVPPPTKLEIAKGMVALLVPMPRWNITQPGDIAIRTFERGGKISRINPGEIGSPNLAELDEGGEPDMKLSDRGLGTQLLISSPVLNVHKTRLNDPHLSFMGTNDHPGDYRTSGCASCHVVYANDRDPSHSGPYAEFGHTGNSFSKDPTIPKDETGHPISHQLTRAIPSSQCMVCHMHQPNSFINTFYGFQMWDYESDGKKFYPKTTQHLTDSQRKEALEANPEGAVVKGLWHDGKFLNSVWDKNKEMKNTQFADYHGHGWNFRAVFKKDRKGNMLDENNQKVSPNDPHKFDKAVHLADIHLDKGMHCVDCHFSQDSHGNGNLYGAYADAITIGCQDCHGTAEKRANLVATGPAGSESFENTVVEVGGNGRKRFVWKGDQLYQRSSLYADKEWHVPQVIDTVNAASSQYNEKAARAKLIKTMNGSIAHSNNKMTCYACHSSWVTNCFGCHLPQEANEKREMKHYEGGESRNWTSYNPQVLRDESYMLGKWGPSKDRKIAPVRSSSALLISSMNANREQIYFEQAPISTPGYSSQAFNPHFPHTVRKTETQNCTSCHLSENNDNNAWMAQLLLFGTNTVNFMGRYVYVGEDGAIDAVKVTESEEPQAVIGSNLHSLAYPDEFKAHGANHKELKDGHEHHADTVKCLQRRGEYLYTANGKGGLRVFDVANVDNKGFSERIVTAPVSPLGQKAYVDSADATCLVLPTNMPIDPTREVIPANQEQPWHPLYHYAYVSDLKEGLIIINVDTLADGNPDNNFLKRALTYNPDGILDGATYLTMAGNYVYVSAEKGLVVINIDDPLNPRVVKVLGEKEGLKTPHNLAVQFRYLFVGDSEGLKVVDITNPENPVLTSARVDVPVIHDIYIARTYAYVAAGPDGLWIVDVTNPEKPFVEQKFTADGVLNDVHSVRIASTNASIFAYVADGKNGLRVIQLTSPESVPEYYGFSPKTKPELIATYHTHKPALSLSKAMDRDRAVDESGNQVSVFGRLGSGPLSLEEMRKLYLRNGKVYRVKDQ